VGFLDREYKVDAQGAREALFGPEPAMDAHDRPTTRPSRNIGPWGAAGGRR
jgi:hypothetical protein